MMLSTRAVVVLIATIAAASCVHASASASANAPAFCRDLDCPNFKVLETTDDYELRSYASAAWVR